MNKRYPAMLLAVVAGVGSVVLPTAVAPASAASLCQIEVTSIRNYENQDNDSQDEIRFDLGDDEHGTFTFNEGQTRNISLGTPTETTTGSSVWFRMREKDSVVYTTLGTRWLTCNDGDHESAPLDDNGGGYILKYTTTHTS